ncbi:MAG: hypothetical protein ACI4J2_00105 [Ruminococcus sp.]
MNTFSFNDVKEINPNRFADSPLGRQYPYNECVEVKFEIIQNKLDGCAREKQVGKELREKYPPELGYSVLSEVYLRDINGNIVVDPITGTKRRIDFVIEKDGRVVDMVEVTSKTAPKGAQMAKENRIRNAGGNYIKDYDGNLIRIPDSVRTRIDRRD